MSWLSRLLRAKENEETVAKLRQTVSELVAERNDRPRATEVVSPDGSLSITAWNPAYVDQLRLKLSPELVRTKTDAEVVQLWVDRQNYEKVEPRLEVIHMGIEPDGRIKMQLDWNEQFIELLRQRGVPGEVDDELVQNYLSSLTRNVDATLVESSDEQQRVPDEDEIERELREMNPKTVERLAKVARNIKRNRTRVLDK